MLSLAVAASFESYNVKMRAHRLCRPACKVLCLITCLCVNCCGPANVSAASSEGDGLSDSVLGTFYLLESLKAAQHVVDMTPCWPAQACEQPPALSLPCSRRKFGRLNTIRVKAYLAQHQKKLANAIAFRALTLAKSRIGVLVWKGVWTTAVSA